jgi:hypothetical protein
LQLKKAVEIDLGGFQLIDDISLARGEKGGDKTCGDFFEGVGLDGLGPAGFDEGVDEAGEDLAVTEDILETLVVFLFHDLSIEEGRENVNNEDFAAPFDKAARAGSAPSSERAWQPWPLADRRPEKRPQARLR